MIPYYWYNIIYHYTNILNKHQIKKKILLLYSIKLIDVLNKSSKFFRLALIFPQKNLKIDYFLMKLVSETAYNNSYTP